MLYPLILLLGKALGSDVIGDIESTVEEYKDPETWDWNQIFLWVLGIFGVFILIIILKCLWKKCKKHHKSSKKKSHQPLLEMEHNRHVAHLPPQVNYGYVDPNAYPYLPPAYPSNYY